MNIYNIFNEHNVFRVTSEPSYYLELPISYSTFKNKSSSISEKILKCSNEK